MPQDPPTFDVIILGAGASGLFCAGELARRGKRVLILEKNSAPGKKILISGGGRANFTNLHATAANYVSENVHFAKSALKQYTQQDFVNYVQTHGIDYYEKKLGQLFCKHSAKELLRALLKDIETPLTQLLLSVHVEFIKKTEDFFYVKTSQGHFKSSSLIVATGGLSISKIGASDFGYKVAQTFGHTLTATDPALCGFTFKKTDLPFFSSLSGVSLNSRITCHKKTFEENILFTHWGLSGPAALQASLYWNPGETLHIDLLPHKSLKDVLTQKKLSQDKRQLLNVLRDYFPERFLTSFFERQKIKSKPASELSNKYIEDLHGFFHHWMLTPLKPIGYDRAEVTRGGVNTDELSSKSMESKLTPGLFFIGEVVDVTGELGGFNFQWAWSSAFVAAQHA